MSRITDTTAYERIERTVLPIELGGTGATTVETAIESLGSIDHNKLAAISGIASLDAENFVPEEQLPYLPGVEIPSLDGPSSVHRLDTVQYEITNFDSLKTYHISAQVGTISRAGKFLNYTAPSTLGPDVIKVNDKSVAISIIDSNINQPSIITPVTSVINTDVPFQVLVSAISFTGYHEANYSLVCEVSVDSNFATIDHSETVANNDQVMLSIPALADFYIRVKYLGTALGSSLYSDSVHITKFIEVYPRNEVALLHSADATSNEWFGNSVAMNQVGDRVIIGAIYDDLGAINATGAAYIFRKENSIWIQEAKLTSTNTSVIKEFGNSVSMSDDGSVVVVGSYLEAVGGNTGVGVGYVFRRTGTSWNLETKLTPSYVHANDNNAQSVTISPNGQYIALGAPWALGDADSQGQVYIYKYNLGVWEETILSAPIGAGFFGFNLAFDTNADRLVVGCNWDYNAYYNNQTPFYIYKRTGAVWTIEQILYINVSQIQVGGSFNQGPVAINADGSRLIIGASKTNSGALTGAGAVYIYTRANTTWTLESILTTPNPESFGRFGTSVAMNQTGNMILVGEPYTTSVHSGIYNNDGNAYIYKLEQSTWTLKATFSSNPLIPNTFFGMSCDLDGVGLSAIIGINQGSIDDNWNTEGTASIFT